MNITDRHEDCDGNPMRWTFGDGVQGRFGGAYPDGTAGLHYWIDKGEAGQILMRKVVKCRSYRRAVRVLRWHLLGYGV